MAKLTKWLLLGLLCSAAFMTTVRCEDEVDEEGDVEADDEDVVADVLKDARKDVEDDEDDGLLKASTDAEVMILFTEPPKSKELPAGKLVRFLVNFFNKGDSAFNVTELDASFRYPQDYSFTIFNYTAAKIDQTVESGAESTFQYAFMTSDAYAGRPLGLVVNLRYTDAKGKSFQNAVFNETVLIVEDDGNFNPETGFLYIVFAALIVLLLLLGRQLTQKMRKRAGMNKSYKSMAPVETGTTGKGDVDFEWIPRQVLENAKKSPGRSPPGSARNRRAKAQKAE